MLNSTREKSRATASIIGNGYNITEVVIITETIGHNNNDCTVHVSNLYQQQNWFMLQYAHKLHNYWNASILTRDVLRTRIFLGEACIANMMLKLIFTGTKCTCLKKLFLFSFGMALYYICIQPVLSDIFNRLQKEKEFSIRLYFVRFFCVTVCDDSSLIFWNLFMWFHSNLINIWPVGVSVVFGLLSIMRILLTSTTLKMASFLSLFFFFPLTYYLGSDPLF